MALNAALEAPHDDPVYRSVLALREPGDLQKRLPMPVLAARIVQTHYKPFARARIVAELIFERARGIHEKQVLFVNVYSSPERAREKFLRSVSEPALLCYGPPVIFFEDSQAVAWSLPNGPKLDSARFCFYRDEFSRFLSEHGCGFVNFESLPQLIRYVPRKRALFRFAMGETVYIKLYRPEEDDSAARNLTLINEAADRGELRFRPPRKLLHDSKRHAVMMSEVAGTQLTDLSGAAVLSAIGRALASLHSSSMTPLVSWTPQREMTALTRAMADVKTALPTLKVSVDSLLSEIEDFCRSLEFDEQTPIHANLFGDQILVDSDHVGIVDWDDLALGDPLYDVGRLVAHFIYLSLIGRAPSARHLEALLSAYEHERGRGIALDRLRWHIAMALLMRAKISSLRSLRPGWLDHTLATITAAKRVLRDEDEWLP